MIVDVVATGADMAARRTDIGSGAVIVATGVAGVFLHLRSGVADDAIAATGVGRAAREPTRFIVGAEVKQFGKTIAVGTIDLKPTLDRINAKRVLNIAHDGEEFINKKGLLPLKPAKYYREWVHPTPGVSGAGPQRIVTGLGGEIYYTPDHYATFVPVR